MHTPTHTDCCCVMAVLCVCSGGRAPTEPSHSFLTIYVTAAARAPGSLFTLLTSLRSLLWLHLSSSLGKSHAEGISSSTLSYLVHICPPPPKQQTTEAIPHFYYDCYNPDFLSITSIVIFISTVLPTN